MSAVESYLPYRAPWLVRLVDPEDESETGDSRLLSETAGCSGSVKVYPEKLRGKLREDAALGASVLHVDAARDFEDVAQIELVADDLTRSTHTIDSIDAEAGTITITDTIPKAAARGSRVRGYLGSYALEEYGTPAVSDKNWGWQATIPQTLAVAPGDRVMIEIEFDASGASAGVAVFPILGIVDDGRQV
jgi:hypothetical protein